MNNEIRELSMDELEAVSGGIGSGAKILSALCEVAADLAKGVGATVAAYYLYTAAGELLH